MSDSSTQPDGLTYPSHYPIKLFLKPDPEAEPALLARLLATLDEGNRFETRRNSSSGGKYECITLDYTAQNEAEVERLRAAIQAEASIILSL